MGLLSGFAKINDFGVKVLEAGVAPPIRISIGESRQTTVSRQEQASIATSTPQQQAITEALEKVITAINQAFSLDGERRSMAFRSGAELRRVHYASGRRASRADSPRYA